MTTSGVEAQFDHGHRCFEPDPTRATGAGYLTTPAVQPCDIDWHERLVIHAEWERLVGVIQDMAHELLQVEQNCPCGARPETPATHPHVGGCPVERALDAWERGFVRGHSGGSSTEQVGQ